MEIQSSLDPTILSIKARL